MESGLKGKGAFAMTRSHKRYRAHGYGYLLRACITRSAGVTWIWAGLRAIARIEASAFRPFAGALLCLMAATPMGRSAADGRLQHELNHRSAQPLLHAVRLCEPPCQRAALPGAARRRGGPGPSPPQPGRTGRGGLAACTFSRT